MRLTITAPSFAAAEIGVRCFSRHQDERLGSFSVTCSADDGDYHVQFYRTKAGVSIKVATPAGREALSSQMKDEG